MFCRNCGTQLNDGAKFCGKCGTAIVSAAPPVGNAQPAPPVQTQAAPPTPPVPETPAVTPAPPAPQSNLCASCGTELKEDWKICPSCGTVCGAAAPPQYQPPPPKYQQQPLYQAKAAEAFAQCKKHPIITSIVAVLAIILIIGIASGALSGAGTSGTSTFSRNPLANTTWEGYATSTISSEKPDNIIATFGENSFTIGSNKTGSFMSGSYTISDDVFTGYVPIGTYTGSLIDNRLILNITIDGHYFSVVLERVK
jgi:RNA polymerase subunit RPABC4/transcription elongation factor Spt4